VNLQRSGLDFATVTRISRSAIMVGFALETLSRGFPLFLNDSGYNVACQCTSSSKTALASFTSGGVGVNGSVAVASAPLCGCTLHTACVRVRAHAKCSSVVMVKMCGLVEIHTPSSGLSPGSPSTSIPRSNPQHTPSCATHANPLTHRVAKPVASPVVG
jgi:hypothetical protein